MAVRKTSFFYQPAVYLQQTQNRLFSVQDGNVDFFDDRGTGDMGAPLPHDLGTADHAAQTTQTDSSGV